MFELIEDNKKLLLILLISLLIISSVYINLNSTEKIKTSQNTLTTYENMLNDLKRKSIQTRNRNYTQQYYQYEPQVHQNVKQKRDIVYKNTISKNSIEDLIKGIKKSKKKNTSENIEIADQSNKIGKNDINMNKTMDSILESDKNFNRIADLIKFKMNPTQNRSPDMENNISMIKTGCNKDNNFELSGFDGKWNV